MQDGISIKTTEYKTDDLPYSHFPIKKKVLSENKGYRTIPKPYMIDKGQVKAINLGCDPSNSRNIYNPKISRGGSVRSLKDVLFPTDLFLLKG